MREDLSTEPFFLCIDRWQLRWFMEHSKHNLWLLLSGHVLSTLNCLGGDLISQLPRQNMGIIWHSNPNLGKGWENRYIWIDLSKEIWHSHLKQLPKPAYSEISVSIGTSAPSQEALPYEGATNYYITFSLKWETLCDDGVFSSVW